MTQPKILFDECLGRPHIEFLKQLFRLEDEDARPVIEHLLSFQGQGIWDEDWIPRIANEGWILVSGDKSRHKKGKGEPLSRVCAQHGVTHVLLSPTVNSRKVFDKMLTILSVWYPILELVDRPRGSRFMIEPSGSGPSDRGKGRLVEKPYLRHDELSSPGGAPPTAPPPNG